MQSNATFLGDTGNNLSPIQERAIVALLSNSTMKRAARSVGVDEATLWRWLQDKDFHAAYMTARRETVQHALARLQQVSTEAVNTLREVMRDKTAKGSERVSAAKAIKGLSEALLVDLIQAIVPGVPSEVAQSIAHECERSPKLAVLIARRIKEDRSLISPQRLLADGQVRSMLDRYFKHDLTEPEWKALSTIAILTRLGWQGEFEHESEALFRAVGLDPIDARRYVEDLHDRFGIAPLAGRFRYVSPAILADHLAIRQLSAWTRERLQRVLVALTPAMADSFARRTRRLSYVLSNREVIEEVILGSQGPFRDLEDLESSQIPMLLRHLAAPFPRASLATLRRVINQSSLDDLRNAKSSRREVVWAIEQLLWPEETFEGAAELLLRLAVAENESWGNNASATWVETFQTVLGRTAAGIVPRARLLRRAATSKDSIERKLAAKALGAALKFEHINRSGMPPSEIEGMPAQEWRPSTYQEWADAVITYLEILTPLLKDSDEEVKQTAVSSFANGLTAALAVSTEALECWISSALSLSTAEYSLRAAICQTLEITRARWESKLNKDYADIDPDENDEDLDETERARRADAIRKQLARLAAVADELRGKDFSSRLRSTLARSTWRARRQHEREVAEQEIVRDLETLAVEALAQPNLLDDEWNWLLESKHGFRAEQWIQVLGRIDNRRTFQPVLNHLTAQSSRARMWVSLYDLSYAQAIEDASFIDRRVMELMASESPREQIFDLLYRAGYLPSRLQVMVSLIRSGDIPSGFINMLAYYPWGPNLSASEAVQLAEAALAHTENPTTVTPFVSSYLDQKSEAKEDFQDLAIRIILAAEKHSIKEFPDDWANLARIYIDRATAQIARIALQRVVEQKYSVDGDVQDVLLSAWKNGDKKHLFREVFAPLLTQKGIESWSLRHSLAWFPFTDLEADFLINWVAENPEERAYPLADVIQAPSGQFSELHATLLEKFDEHGVGSAFFSSIMSGSWMGSAADWTRSKLDRARPWLEDLRPAVREWARSLVRNLEEELKRNETRDAEERLYR